MNVNWTPLWSDILDSSVWVGTPKDVKIVWVSILALKDVDGNVTASLPAIAKKSELSIPETIKAMEYLLAPDQYSRFPDHAGRRLIPLSGQHGWHVVSHDHYKKKIQELRTKASNRARQAKLREAKGRTYKTLEERINESQSG